MATSKKIDYIPYSI